MRKFFCVILIMIMLTGTLVILSGCAMRNIEEGEISLINPNDEYTIDYEDEKKLEEDLKNDVKVLGKTVKFVVSKYFPNSSVGYNVHSGEHLNFISDADIEVKENDEIIGQIKYIKKYLDSYIIGYNVLEIRSFTKVEEHEEESNNSKDEEQTKQEENEKQEESSFDIEDSLNNIANEYYLNEARANAHYFSKKIKITATITNIDVDSSVLLNMGVTVSLKENGAKYYVKCNFKGGDSSGIMKYNKGDKITIIGTMDEKIGNWLYMKKCDIVE